MITTPEIICDVFSFLDKDQIERTQLVNQFWNNVIIRHKNILPLRLFENLYFNYEQFHFYATKEDRKRCASYIIKFDGTNLIKDNYIKGLLFGSSLYSQLINFDGTNLIKGDLSSRYSQLIVDEVLTNLNDVVFDTIEINRCDSERSLDYLLNMMKLVTTKIGGRFRGRFGTYDGGRFGSKLNEIFDNYIIVDELTLGNNYIIVDGLCIDNGYNDSYTREVCANPEIVQLPSTPKEIRFEYLKFNENEEVLNFTCNGKLNGANRVTIRFETPKSNSRLLRQNFFENFIWQWFELYRTHENPISLVGKFELIYDICYTNIAHDAVKTFLNNTQLRVKYSLETKELHSSFYGVINQYVKRSCVLHEMDSYALVIEMEYGEVTDMSSINASDLNQPPWDKRKSISFCVKSL